MTFHRRLPLWRSNEPVDSNLSFFDNKIWLYREGSEQTSDTTVSVSGCRIDPETLIKSHNRTSTGIILPMHSCPEYQISSTRVKRSKTKDQLPESSSIQQV